MTTSILRVVLAITLALAAATARADAIPGPPPWRCLPGTRLSLGHGGTSCTPTDCSADGTNGVCPEGLVCTEAVALFPEPGSPPPFPEMRPVATDCACEPTRCVRARWCVPPDAEPYVCTSHAPPSARPEHAGAASCAVSPARTGTCFVLGLVVLACLALNRRARSGVIGPGLCVVKAGRGSSGP